MLTTIVADEASMTPDEMFEANFEDYVGFKFDQLVTAWPKALIGQLLSIAVIVQQCGSMRSIAAVGREVLTLPGGGLDTDYPEGFPLATRTRKGVDELLTAMTRAMRGEIENYLETHPNTTLH